MTQILDPPLAAGSTLYPHDGFALSDVQAAEEFCLRGVDREPDRRIEVRVAADRSLRRMWLATYAEEQVNALLRLPPGWDGYRGRQLTQEAVAAAIDVLFAIADDMSLPPQLFPLPDGGIQLEWHAAGWDVEIEVDSVGSGYALATDAEGAVIADGEVTPGQTPTLTQVQDAVRRLSARLAGGR